MRVALVYDRVSQWGGAERVLLALHQIWPQAPLYTSVYDSQQATWAKGWQVRTSFLNRWPLAQKHHELFPWLMPLAFESHCFSNFDLVISVTSEAAKGIVVQPPTKHFCYCLTPTRYLWSGYEQYFATPGKRWLAKPLVSYLRYWDRIAAQRPDLFFATCENVKQRLKKYYQREAKVIYPPLAVNKWQPLSGIKGADYFLVVSRLVVYKKLALVIKTFNQLGLPLKIVGQGRQLLELQRLAGANTEFLGYLTDQQLLGYYQKCRAVIFPQEEDFGMVPLEAQSCGRPVIAYRAGGAKETVSDGKTGLFFDKQTVASLTAAIKRFEKIKFDPKVCRQNVLRFDQTRFLKIFKKECERQWKNFPN